MAQMTREEFLDIRNNGFVRVAVVIPRVHLANPKMNAVSHLAGIRKVYEEGAMYALCPELGLTGYTCGDLFHDETLLRGVIDALEFLLEATRPMNIVVSVGMPLILKDSVYNVAVTFYKGRVLAIVPKAYPPNYREFYEGRHFARASDLSLRSTNFFGYEVPVGTDILIS